MTNRRFQLARRLVALTKLGAAALALAALLPQAAALAQDAPPAQPALTPIEIGAPSRPSNASARSVGVITSSERGGYRLARSMASAASRGVVQSGIEIAKESILECQKGDYPGGGMGLLSMPMGRPASRIDHCFR